MIDTATLTDRLIRAAAIPEVARWLREREGWLTSTDDQRTTDARHVLFMRWLVRQGRCSDA